MLVKVNRLNEILNGLKVIKTFEISLSNFIMKLNLLINKVPAINISANLNFAVLLSTHISMPEIQRKIIANEEAAIDNEAQAIE